MESTTNFSEKDVELRLKLALWGRRYNDLKIHKIKNKHLRVQFENRNTKSNRVVVTWARSDESASTIARRGFEIEPEGKSFSVSSPNPCLFENRVLVGDKDDEEEEEKEGKITTLNSENEDPNIVTAFLCAVDVGKSIPVSRSKDRAIDSLERPSESDSIHVCRKSLAELSDAFGNVVKSTSIQNCNKDSSSQEVIEGDYDHTYVVYEPTQILPLYMVRFRLEPKQDSKITVICMNCEMKPAVMHCPQCNTKLCLECDTTHHGQKLLRGHKRYRIVSDGMMSGNQMMMESGNREKGFSSVTIRSMCPKHPKQPVEFFDPILHVPVCIHCKMTGSHARGAVMFCSSFLFLTQCLSLSSTRPYTHFFHHT